jgi:hypothetical protein
MPSLGIGVQSSRRGAGGRGHRASSAAAEIIGRTAPLDVNLSASGVITTVR